MSKRWEPSRRGSVAIGFALLLVLATGFWAAGGVATFGPQPTPTPIADMTDFENLITASGTLLPSQRANLAFRAGGQVVQVAAKAGDQVKKGDTLARLDASEAEAAIAVAVAALNQLKAGATKDEIAVAQAALDTAQAQLAQVRAGPTVEDLAIAKATLDRALSGLKDAQAAYDKIKDDPAVGMFPQSQAYEAAIQQYRIAEAGYQKIVKGASAADIRIAEASVAAAQAALRRVQAAARPEDIAAAQARVDQAKVALSALTIAAPFDGTIATVNIREGEVVMPGVPVALLGDVRNLRLETDDLSETNVARVQLGQLVSVSFEALPGKIFQGKVTDISPIAAQKQGGTNYTVTIEFDKLDPALRWGMTGHIEINAK